MIFQQFAVNFFIVTALSSSSWGNRGKFGRAVSAQEHEHVRIHLSKEEASSVLEDGRDSLDPDSDPLAGMNDGSDVRKLSKKGSKNMPAPIPPVPDTSTEDDEDDPATCPTPTDYLMRLHALRSDQRDYLKALGEATATSFPIPNPSESEGRAAGDSAKIVASFPDGVFDMEKRADAIYMMDIQKRCTAAVASNTTTRSEYLGCHIYFDVENPQPPMALGPLLLRTNIYEAMNKGKYGSYTFANIFTPDAMAVMIKKGCYSLDTSYDAQDYYQFDYVDEKSYSKSLSESNGVDVQTNVGYGPVSVTAGYNKQTAKSSSSSGTSKAAYGQKQYWAQVGVLVNRCLNSKTSFQTVIRDNNLIKPKVIDAWTMMQAATDAKTLASTTEFQLLAFAGQQVPTEYVYGAAVDYSIRANYEDTSSSSSKDASSAITAGLEVKVGKASGGVNSAVTDAVNSTSTSSGLSITVTVSAQAVGGNLTTDCLINDTCATDVVDTRNEIRSNLNRLGLPYSHSVFIDLDFIVRWQTGKRLGSVYMTALKDYYSYAQCIPEENESISKPSHYFNTFYGNGTLKKENVSCPPYTICTTALYQGEYQTVGEIEPFMCDENPDPSCQIEPSNALHTCKREKILYAYMSGKDCERDCGKDCMIEGAFVPTGHSVPPSMLGGACGMERDQKIYTCDKDKNAWIYPAKKNRAMFQDFDDCLIWCLRISGGSGKCFGEYKFIPAEEDYAGYQIY